MNRRGFLGILPLIPVGLAAAVAKPRITIEPIQPSRPSKEFNQFMDHLIKQISHNMGLTSEQYEKIMKGMNRK